MDIRSTFQVTIFFAVVYSCFVVAETANTHNIRRHTTWSGGSTNSPPKLSLFVSSEPSQTLLLTSSPPTSTAPSSAPSTVFVALSRVGHTDHMRLLHNQNNNKNSLKIALKYLSKLRPNKYVAQFYSGFQNNNGKWNRHTAQISYY
jgi:hypothetical protein